MYAEVVSSFSVQNAYLNNGKVLISNSGVTAIKFDLGFTRYLISGAYNLEPANIFFKIVAINSSTNQVIQDLSQLYNITTADFNSGPQGTNTNGIYKTYDINITYNSTLAGVGQNLRIGLLWKSNGQTPPSGYPNGMWMWTPLYQVEIITTPVIPPLLNDEYSGAITLTPSPAPGSMGNSKSAYFANSTITQTNYENFGIDGGSTPSSQYLGDVWYKFTAINNTHDIFVSSPYTLGYWFRVELFSISGSTLRLMERESSVSRTSILLKTSGLNIGQTYYFRIVLGSGVTTNKDITLNYICVTTPAVQSPVIKAKVRYDNSEGFMYHGNTLGLSFVIPQNIPESDLSFDWRLINQQGQVGEGGAVNGSFLYKEEDGSPINNGTYSLLNVKNRRVKIGLGPKSPAYAHVQFWAFHVQVRVKRISTNTYLYNWTTASGLFMTEL